MRRWGNLAIQNWPSAARRAFWASLLVMHFSALGAEWRALAALGFGDGWGPSLFRSATLSASAAFFLLKILDVSWLRLKPGWRSVVASCVVVGLLHLNVIDRTTGSNLSGSGTPLGLVLFAGGTLAADSMLKTLRRSPAGGAVGPDAAKHQRYGIFVGWNDVAVVHQKLFISDYLSPRGPPSAR